MHTSLRRGGTLLAASALSLATLVAPIASPASAAEHDAGPATAGAGWLTGQLTDGLLQYPTAFGPFTDYGLSIDAALGLDALGGQDATVQAIRDAVRADLDP